MPWTFPIKAFNFRSTGSFGTELTNEIGAVNGTSGATWINLAGGLYPRTANVFVGQGAESVLCGWVANLADFTYTDRNASPTSGTEFCGNTAVANTSANNPHHFRVDLPDAGGTYQIQIAMGAYTGTQNCYYDVYDGDPSSGGVRITPSGPYALTAVPANSFGGGDGNIVGTPASYAAWIAASFVIQRTFTDTGGPGGTPRLFVRIGDPAKAASGNTTLSHLRIVQGASAPNQQYYYNQRKVLYFI